MQSRCLLQVVLILCAVHHVIGLDLCVRTSPADGGQTRVFILREDVDGARALYLSLWSEDRPVTCEVNTDTLVIEGYRRICTRSHDTSHRFNISQLLAPDSPCVNVSSAQKFGTRTRRDGNVRRKRSWIFPGTLWCGTGSRAAGYEQLGMFESADRCCREHDHCLHIIHSFTVNYGVFNSNFFTVSHCDCDQRFRECLLGVNDTISSMVGYSFFNILRVPCFQLKQQRRCTEASWWGTCKVKQNTPIAIFHKPLPYSNAPSNNDSTMLTTTERQHTTGNVDRKSPRGQHRCRSREDTLYLRRKKLRGCKTHRKVSPVSRVDTTTPPITARPLNASAFVPDGARAGNSSLLDHPTPRSRMSPQVMTNSYPVETSTTQSTPSLTQPTAATALTTRHRKIPKQSHCCGLKMPLRGDTFQPRCRSCPEGNTTSDMARVTRGSPARTHLKPAASSHQDGELQQQMDLPLQENRTSQEPEDKQLLCGSLKHLDECKHRIRPLEKKYNLQNTESKTSYHCDCTSRLAVGMQSVKPSSVVPELLMDFVSQFCFKLPKETKCNRGESCSRGFYKASDLLEALKMTERKDAAGVQHSARRRGIPTRLYKRCLRLEREADVMARLTRS